MSKEKSLKSRTLTALMWDMGGTFLKKGNGFIISIFLARLLEPAEFGLVGMAMVFISIFQVLIDVGFSSAIVQKKDAPPGAYDTIFFINIGIGFALAAVFYASAPFIAEFYRQPEVENLIKWLSLLCIIKSFNQVQMSLLKKSLDFKLLTVRLVAGNVVGGVVGVAMAFMGFGVYSLVAQNLVSASISTITMWTVAGWRPSWYFRFADIRGMISYSTFILMDRLLSEITKKVDVLIVGRMFAADTLGFYTRATSVKDQVTTYSSTSLTKVLFPVFSTLQDQAEEYERIYFRVFSVIVFVSYLLTGLLYILGQDLIILLFGAKWMPSVIIFQVIILAAGNYPMSAVMVNAFISKGLSKQNFFIGILRKLIRLSALSVVIFGDMVLFVTAIVISSYIITAVNMVMLNRFVGLSILKHVVRLLPGLLALVGIVVIDHFFGTDTVLFRLFFAFSFLISYIAYHHFTKADGYLFVVNTLKSGMNKKGRLKSKSTKGEP